MSSHGTRTHVAANLGVMAAHAMMLARCSLVLLCACEFPSRSERFACETTADCEQGRTCEQGYCVRGDAGIDARDAAPDMRTADADVLAMMCPPAGYTYQAAPGGYYRVITTGANWVNSQAACAGDVPGSTHLAVLSTAAEVSFVEMQLTGTQVEWVGLSARNANNQWGNVTGEVGDQRPWGMGEPNGTGGNANNCAAMLSDARIYDRSCGDNYRAVCECDGLMSAP